MTHWVMVVDLKKCIACNTCVQVCKDANHLHVAWRRLIEQDLETASGPDRVSFTLGCMHCENPSCLAVCPTTATRRRPDGIVTIDTDLCVGCGACITACPYDARVISTIDTVSSNETRPPGNNAKNSDRIGVCTKCDFCRDRIDEAIANGKLPGIDDAATPVCVGHCIADALHFGDLDDPASIVSKLLQERQSFTLREDLGNRPSVFFVY